MEILLSIGIIYLFIALMFYIMMFKELTTQHKHNLIKPKYGPYDFKGQCLMICISCIWLIAILVILRDSFR